MVKTGCIFLDEFLGYYDNEISMIYGSAATGKTTIAILAAIQQVKENRKVVFIDTENGFSIDRFKQLGGNDKLLDNIFLIKIENFKEQEKKIENLLNIKNIDLIIIDTISLFYRYELKKDSFNTNKSMDKQLQILNQISNYIPVILINQVYTNIEKGGDCLVGGEMLKKWSGKLVKLEKNPRKIILEKPICKNCLFEIKENGVFKK